MLVKDKGGNLMTNKIIVKSRSIGDGEKTYIIAELGINHKGDVSLARDLIKQAALSGADAVKIQTYVTEKRVAKDSPIFGILKECELNYKQQQQLFDFAQENGITLFSTPFDDDSVDFLESVNNPCYKVASFDLVNKQLLNKIVSKQKPMIISRGMASQSEMDQAVAIARKANIPFAMLHCVSAYPVKSLASLNLKTIRVIAEIYQCPTGFSDHTSGIEIAKYAVAAGANIIEKHFTLSRENGAPDNPVSIEPKELKQMAASIRKTEEILGENRLGNVAEEEGTLQFRRET
jgi:sialic acid synthase SpsE